MNDVYKGHSLFNDVADADVRTWNRCATFLNLLRDFGRVVAQDYIKQLDDISQQYVKKMFARIQEEGYERTKQSIIRNS